MNWKKMATSLLNPQIRIKLSELDIHKNEDNEDTVIGSGGYGNIYKATYLPKGETVALKKMISQGCVPEREKGLLIKEAQGLMLALGHENILKMFGIVMERDHYGLVLEYMQFGSVTDFLKDYQVLMALVLRISKQVISAMDHLHSLLPQMKHLDLKADNVLINNLCNAKVCDFGLAEWKHTTRTMTKKLQSQHENRCGTLSHIAPEVLENINCMATVYWDIYAFGIMLWEIFAGKKPYANCISSLIQLNVLHGQRPPLTEVRTDCPEAIKSMIKLCWHQTISLRPQFKELSLMIAPVYKQYEYQLPGALQHIRQQVVHMHPPETELYECTKDLGADQKSHIHKMEGIFEGEMVKPEVTIPTIELTLGCMLTPAVSSIENKLKNQISNIYDIEHTNMRSKSVTDQTKETMIIDDNMDQKMTFETDRKCNQVHEQIISISKFNENRYIKGQTAVCLEKLSMHNPDICKEILQDEPGLFLSTIRDDVATDLQQELRDYDKQKLRNGTSIPGPVLPNFEEMWMSQKLISLEKTENLFLESHLGEPESIQHKTQDSLASETGSLSVHTPFQHTLTVDALSNQNGFNISTSEGSSPEVGYQTDVPIFNATLSDIPRNPVEFQQPFPEQTNCKSHYHLGGTQVQRKMAAPEAPQQVQHAIQQEVPMAAPAVQQQLHNLKLPFRRQILPSPMQQINYYLLLTGTGNSSNVKFVVPIAKQPTNNQPPLPTNRGCLQPSQVGGEQPLPVHRSLFQPSQSGGEQPLPINRGYVQPSQSNIEQPLPINRGYVQPSQSNVEQPLPINRGYVQPSQSNIEQPLPINRGYVQPSQSNIEQPLPINRGFVQQSQSNIEQPSPAHRDYFQLSQSSNENQLPIKRGFLQLSQSGGEQQLPVHRGHVQPSQSNGNQNQPPTVVTSIMIKPGLNNLEPQQRLLQKSQVSISDPVQNGEAICHKSTISPLGSNHPFRQESLCQQQYPLRSSMDHPDPQIVQPNGGKKFDDMPFPSTRSQNIPVDMPFPDAMPKNFPITSPFQDARLMQSQSDDDVNIESTEKTRSTPSLLSMKKRSPPSFSSQMSETSNYNHAETDTIPVTPSRLDAPTTILHKHAGGGLTALTIRSANGDNLPNIQIGSNMKMTVYQGYKTDKQTKSKSKKTSKTYKPSDLPKSECGLTADQMHTIAVEIGKDWKRLSKELQLTDDNIEKLQFDHFDVDGFYEVTYQALCQWTEIKGKNATVKVMGKSLWNIDRVDVALKLAKL